jgi:hypothetical protein
MASLKVRRPPPRDADGDLQKVGRLPGASDDQTTNIKSLTQDFRTAYLVARFRLAPSMARVVAALAFDGGRA